jgi:cell division GTPase FtsZ
MAKTTTKRKRNTKTKARKTTSRPRTGGNGSLIPTLDLEKFEIGPSLHNGVKDHSKGSVRYAWLGSGQCGGRLAKAFYDLGYGKALAVNTTNNDLDLLELPDNQKFIMDIGVHGAGKDMNRGGDAIGLCKQEVLHTAEQIFGDEVDHIMVCFGAGGGTGGGSATGLIELAKNYAKRIGIKKPNQKVGVVMTLPTGGETSSPLIASNAYKIATELTEMAAAKVISPLVIIDNAKINTMYPGLTVKEFWPTINNTVSGMFDIFNRLSALPSQYTSFDQVDYHSIMSGGGCSIMGLTQISSIKDKFAISSAVRNNLEKTLLASGFELGTAKLAGCIMVGGKKMMANVPGLQDNINYAFDVLSEITGKATVHRGIYEDNRETLRVYTIIGGLEKPTERLDELCE